jgi:hypothetical protein
MITSQSIDLINSYVEIERLPESQLHILWFKFAHLSTEATKSYSNPDYAYEGLFKRVQLTAPKLKSVKFCGHPSLIQEIINYHSTLMEN